MLGERQRKAGLKFLRKYRKLSAEDWENFLFTYEWSEYLFQYPNPKNDIVWGSQENEVPPAYQVKKSSKWMVWGDRTGCGLTKLHFLPPGQTLTSDYYVSEILENEVKPLISRRKTTGEPVEQKPRVTGWQVSRFEPDRKCLEYY